ncbi:glycosyltransferase family 61 protein [Hyalangium sp.]|uniref:glycosyltransferase family 61 protein n=1 Tax=Hyalangium sp. TaxID=2028555 RepID=UPI002D75E68D|nr:glycosyltransferase family 61 protein [Hyalangium sp.]HYH95858.1 glycosyltransferase family 61 protein [Hyalangium sp.]
MLRLYSRLASHLPGRSARERWRLRQRCGALFDPAYYLARYPDIAAARVDPLDHFLEHGVQEKRNPHPLFDTAYYLARYPDVVAARLNPLAHFLDHCVQEKRNPNPLFDTAYYLARYPDIAATGANPLLHFLSHGAREGRKPHPLFDTAWYLVNNPDVVASGVNPLAHFLEHGVREKRDPNPLFDTAWYLGINPDIAAMGVNPLAHFLEHGAREGRQPHPLFDPTFYLHRNPDVAATKQNPLAHFLDHGALELRHPHPLFDSDFYARHCPEVAARRENPVVHYLTRGVNERLDPSPLFSTSYYLANYEDVEEAGMNPLAHFIQYGAREGRRPGPVRLSQHIQELLKLGQLELARDLFMLSSVKPPQREAVSVTVAVQVRSVVEELRRRDTLVTYEEAGSTTISAPTLFGTDLQPPAAIAPLMPQYVGVLENVNVVGGTRLILSSDNVLLHDELAQITYGDYGIKTPVHVPFVEKGSAILRAHQRVNDRIEAGVLISCDHDNNYFHWLVECLPKLVFLNTRPEFDGLPLLIGQNLHPNLIHALEVINQGQRPVIRLKDGELYQVRRLILPSDLCRILDRYEGMPVGETDAVLAPSWVRRTAQLLGSVRAAPARAPWRKLYLTRRNAGYRKVRNEHELELMFIEQGFEVVSLEGASFDSQVALFRQASLIVAPTGAALTNLMFCQPGTRVIVLSSNHEGSNFYIFSQLAQVMGLRLEYVVGRRSYQTTAYSVHDDYVISVDLLREVITDPQRGIAHASS